MTTQKERSEQDKQYDREVGERLKRIREAKGLSQAQVAALFKLISGQATISAYERGKKLGRVGMQQYIALLNASSTFIKTGVGDMFGNRKKGEYTRDIVIEALTVKSSGNMQFVSARDLGRFLSGGFAHHMHYHLLPGECFSFPITDYELGSDYPYGSQLICTRYTSTGLTLGRMYVFQLADKLVIRIYSGMNEDQESYRLTCAYGAEISLPKDDVIQVYHVERIDRPVL